MNSKYGRAAILAGISTVLVVFLSSILSSIINGIILRNGIAYDTIEVIYLVVGIFESAVAFLLAVYFGSKLLLQKNVPFVKILLYSIAGGFLESLLLYSVNGAVSQNTGRGLGAVSYILSFAIFYVFALLVDKTIINASSNANSASDLQNPSQAPKATANEDISLRAQYAFNQKLAEQNAGATIVDDVVEAKLFAQAVELQLLKAPATAQFCALEEMTVTSANGIYVVSGYVDSQNSYGAIIRTPFKLTVFKENGNWKSADKIISTSASIQGKVMSNTLAWWILGIVGSIVTFLFYYFFISSQIGF